MLGRKNNVLYFPVVSIVQQWNILSKSNCRSTHLRGCTRPAVHQCVCVTRGHDGGCGGTSGQVGSEPGLITQLLILHRKNPETNQHPSCCCSSHWIHPSTVWLIKQSQSWMLQRTAMWSGAQRLVTKLTCNQLYLRFTFCGTVFVCHCVKATNTCRMNYSQSTSLHNVWSKKHLYQWIEWYWQSQRDL